MIKQKVVVIGAGFAGISVASFLAKAGYSVTVLEKHPLPGGRARKLEAEGFTFDMGPSWYWMPDVFERYFQKFGKNVSDYYSLTRLDPSYRVFWKDRPMDIPADYTELEKLFNELEPGSSKKLETFIAEAAYKYQVGINKLVHKPGRSLSEFLDWNLISGIFRLDVFNSIKTHVNKLFLNEKIRQLLSFPVLFLGALPENTPALYSLMNYADIVGGTWYPKGGMYQIVEGMYQLALELGVQFRFNENVTSIEIENGKAIGVKSDEGKTANTHFIEADIVVGAADYHHIETKLLPKKYRSYTSKYWESRVMAPSCLLYYVGLNKKLKNITHHSLFFDTSFDTHGKEIYTDKQWPSDPMFYMSITSATDDTVAPEGCENLFLLIPVATGLEGDDEVLREKYFNMIMDRLEMHLQQKIKTNVIYKKSFALSDFVEDYNAFKGNAYGLANTLLQTAILKPSCKSKKVSNLFYTGQLTVPGPGVPPSLISGEVVAKEVVSHKWSVVLQGVLHTP
ncbi:phytoene desaturase family protein [Parasediminibacterium sp. JCM 36343]|uniref:phytoene desaturase family protein n=1 Tax=Parasediminibacterium sp. JCM 36343 TaxID=3374279 RepID=UPI00397CEC34